MTLRDRDGSSGSEGQRNADQGDGLYLNPVLAGDRPDPSLLKVGSDYYLVTSSFESVPGLLLWHSGDLVNWEPVGPALRRYVGSVWAPDLVLHEGRFYIYFPAMRPGGVSNMVVISDRIEGPWSDPIDLRIGRIDPGHAVSPEGKRFLFLSDGFLAPLSDDGLSVVGPPEKVYDGWRYPDDWSVESFALEGPKIMRRGGYFYMLSAQGGTAGPPTSHMVVVARSRALQGPWENSPYNPVVRTSNPGEKWWSRGHGTLVEGPDGEQWYLVYHAYENGYRSLGRQTLLEPVAWTEDGWLESERGNVARITKSPTLGRRFSIRIRNDRHTVTLWYRADRENWTKHWTQYEVSGYHHNVAGGFLSLRPALFAAGSGDVRFRTFQYQTLLVH